MITFRRKEVRVRRKHDRILLGCFKCSSFCSRWWLHRWICIQKFTKPYALKFCALCCTAQSLPRLVFQSGSHLWFYNEIDSHITKQNSLEKYALFFKLKFQLSISHFAMKYTWRVSNCLLARVSSYLARPWGKRYVLVENPRIMSLNVHQGGMTRSEKTGRDRNWRGWVGPGKAVRNVFHFTVLQKTWVSTSSKSRCRIF